MLWTINALALELEIDRRTLTRRLDDLAPDEVRGRVRRWKLARVWRHLSGHNADRLDPGQERARRDRAQAEKTELEVLRARGELIPAADVAKAWATIGSNIKGRLLAIPSKTAARVHDAESRHEVHAILSRAVREALNELSNGAAVAGVSSGETYLGANAPLDPATHRGGTGVSDSEIGVGFAQWRRNRREGSEYEKTKP